MRGCRFQLHIRSLCRVQARDGKALLVFHLSSCVLYAVFVRKELRSVLSKIKNGEVLHFWTSAMNNFTEIPWKHFTIGSDLLNLIIKLISLNETSKSKSESLEVLKIVKDLWREPTITTKLQTSCCIKLFKELKIL